MSETRWLQSVNGDNADNIKYVNASDWDTNETHPDYSTSILWLSPEDFGKTIVLNEVPPINPVNLGKTDWYKRFWIMFTGVYQEDPDAEAYWGGDFGEILTGKQYMDIPEGSQIRIVKGYPNTDPVETVTPARDADFQQLRISTDYYRIPFTDREYYPGTWSNYESQWVTLAPNATTGFKYRNWYNTSVGNSATTGLSWGDSIVITKLGSIHWNQDSTPTGPEWISFVMNSEVFAEDSNVY